MPKTCRLSRLHVSSRRSSQLEHHRACTLDTQGESCQRCGAAATSPPHMNPSAACQQLQHHVSLLCLVLLCMLTKAHSSQADKIVQAVQTFCAESWTSRHTSWLSSFTYISAACSMTPSEVTALLTQDTVANLLLMPMHADCITELQSLYLSAVTSSKLASSAGSCCRLGKPM